MDGAGGFVLSPSAGNPDIYEGTIDVGGTGGGAIQYKFVYNNGADQWESRNDRSFVIAGGAQTLPTVYYNDDAVVSVTIKAAVNFQVDLSVQLAAGNFDPATDEVWVRGNRMGWGSPPGGAQLFADASRSGVYTNLYTRDDEVTGTEIQYKLTIWRTDTFETVWEDGDNKTVSFTGDEPVNADGYHVITVAKTYFNGLTPSDVLSADSLVTFRVDMSAAKNGDGSSFDPVTQGVGYNASWVPWWAWNNPLPEYQLVDDGTGGDAVAGDKIYTWQHLFPRGSSARIEYKYGIDSGDNEARSGLNHVRYIRAIGSYTMPVDTFGTMTVEPVVSTLSISAPSGGQVTLTWNGRPGVRLQSASAVTDAAWSDVPETDGQSSKVLTVGANNQFFRLVY